ncbi:UDP-N-acetylmuramate dehydrogenase [Alcaligenes sp. SDU_A2]|uniref:UDP-N-acetylmuramate dehydrogenase n=1 Tax=Alcaligenes sp. SDU_A2 TaxID=3136634 RepID=UPI00311F3768
MNRQCDVDLTSFNTFGLCSRARDLVVFDDVAQLPALQAVVQQAGEVFVLGGGSNVVLAAQVEPLVVKVQSRGIHLLESRPDAYIVQAQAGEAWHDFVQHCLEQGWSGLENLALIPGTVGAAPVQNIGAYGVELEQRVHSVLAWNFKQARLMELPAAQCGFSYRDSRFKHDPAGTWLIVAVRFALPRPWAPVLDYPDLRQHSVLGGAVDAQAVFDAVCQIRRQKLPDPAVLGNAGSFFKNPVVPQAQRDALRAQWPGLVSYDVGQGLYKLAAGWLIDQCGWKGRRDGAVGVHERQALVLVNHGGGTAQDIERLAQAIRADVRRHFGVELEQEPVQVP